MQAETIELYFQQGSSDKVYHLQLESVEEQWSVNAQWGRRTTIWAMDIARMTSLISVRTAWLARSAPSTNQRIRR